MTERSDRQKRASLTLYLVVIVLAPLVFGAVEPFVVAVGGILVAISLAFAPLKGLGAGPRRALWTLLGAMLIFVALFALQLWPDPPAELANPIWSEASRLTGTQIVPRISVAPGQTLHLAGIYLVLAGILALGIVHGSSSAGATTIMRTLALTGAFYAAGAIAAYVLIPDYILWQKKLAYFGNLTTPFINRNTAATYYGSIAILWTALLAGLGHRSSQRAAAAGGLEGDSRFVFNLGGLIIVLVALFMTASRGGIAASLAGLLLFAAVWVAFRHANLTVRMAAAGAGFLAVVVLITIFGETVVARLDEARSGVQRLCTYESVVAAISERPWAGFGLGSFELAFPRFRNPECGLFGTWDRAHNSFLQIAMELGLPAALLGATLWLLAGMTMLNGILARRTGRLFPLTGLAVWATATLHSMVDFSLEIPGYSAIFCAVAGTAMAQALHTRNDHGKHIETSRLRREFGT